MIGTDHFVYGSKLGIELRVLSQQTRSVPLCVTMKGRNSSVISIRIPDNYLIDLQAYAEGRGVSVGQMVQELIIGWCDNKKRPHSVNAMNRACASETHSVNTTKFLPLIDKPVHYSPGVRYTPGQKVLVKQKGKGLVTVIAPELDVDGNQVWES